jgi:hypothetical protein
MHKHTKERRRGGKKSEVSSSSNRWSNDSEVDSRRMRSDEGCICTQYTDDTTKLIGSQARDKSIEVTSPLLNPIEQRVNPQ